jgi:hypothetical protein
LNRERATRRYLQDYIASLEERIVDLEFDLWFAYRRVADISQEVRSMRNARYQPYMTAYGGRDLRMRIGRFGGRPVVRVQGDGYSARGYASPNVDSGSELSDYRSD